MDSSATKRLRQLLLRLKLHEREGLSWMDRTRPILFFCVRAGRIKSVVVAMYHDQGHIAMKLIDFQRTVNVTPGHSDHSDLGGSWYGIRHCRQECSGSTEHDRSHEDGCRNGSIKINAPKRGVEQ